MVLPRFYDKIKGDIGGTSVAGATSGPRELFVLGLNIIIPQTGHTESLGVCG